MTLSRQPCTGGGGGTPYDGLCGDSGFDYLKEKGNLSFESLKWIKRANFSMVLKRRENVLSCD